MHTSCAGSRAVPDVFVAGHRPTTLDNRHRVGHLRASLDSSPENERRLYRVRLRFPHLEGLLHVLYIYLTRLRVPHRSSTYSPRRMSFASVCHSFDLSTSQGLIDTHRIRFSKTLRSSICAEVRPRIHLAICSHINPFWSSSDHRGTPEVGSFSRNNVEIQTAIDLSRPPVES